MTSLSTTYFTFSLRSVSILVDQGWLWSSFNIVRQWSSLIFAAGQVSSLGFHPYFPLFQLYSDKFTCSSQPESVTQNNFLITTSTIPLPICLLVQQHLKLQVSRYQSQLFHRTIVACGSITHLDSKVLSTTEPKSQRAPPLSLLVLRQMCSI